MYGISYHIVDVLERIHLTIDGLKSAIGNPFYGLGEWVLDTIAIWRTW